MTALPSRLKIALLSAGISGLVLIAFGTTAWLLMYDLRMEAHDREIRSLASRHPGLLAGRGNYERFANSIESSFGKDSTNTVILELRDPSTQLLYRSPHWPQDLSLESFGISKASPSTNQMADPGDSWPSYGGRGRGQGMGRAGPPLVSFKEPVPFINARSRTGAWRIAIFSTDEIELIIGLNQDNLLAEMALLRYKFLLALPTALLLVGVGGWVVAARALRPLAAIAQTAERVTARGLDQRIPDSGHSPEVSRLVQVLNRMMDRLEGSFKQAIRFSADASHELKTPLTVMQGELEAVVQSPTAGPGEQQLAGQLLEETQRLKTITSSLLLLAQADAGHLKLAMESVDLSRELSELMEDAQALAVPMDLRFDMEIQPGVIVQSDKALLRAALFNLFRNAVAYNEPKGLVKVSLRRAKEVLLTIGNTGPGISEQDQPRVFERFYRGVPGAANAAGMGLGLSLSREIVRAHGGELELEQSRAGWTSFRVLLRNASALPL